MRPIFLERAGEPKQYEAKEEPDWLVPNLIPTQGMVVLASAPKVGKTVFATALARALCRGESFLGHQLQAAPVVWCAHEESPRERVPLHAGLTPEDPFYIGYRRGIPRLDDPDCFLNQPKYEPDKDRTHYVYVEAMKLGAKLVVIDCLQAAVERTNLADNQSARHIMAKISQWSYYFGCATLVLHHLTKSAHRGYYPERFADSAQILATSSTHLFFERIGTGENPRRYAIHGQGRHPAPPARVEVESRGFFDWRLADESTAERPQTITEQIMNFLKEGPATATEISEALGLKYESVRVTLSVLSRKGKTMPLTSTSQSRPYALVEEEFEPKMGCN